MRGIYVWENWEIGKKCGGGGCGKNSSSEWILLDAIKLSAIQLLVILFLDFFVTIICRRPGPFRASFIRTIHYYYLFALMSINVGYILHVSCMLSLNPAVSVIRASSPFILVRITVIMNVIDYSYSMWIVLALLSTSPLSIHFTSSPVLYKLRLE